MRPPRLGIVALVACALLAACGGEHQTDEATRGVTTARATETATPEPTTAEPTTPVAESPDSEATEIGPTESEPTVTTEPEPTETEPTDDGAATAGTTVLIDGLAYEPPGVTVAVGDTVSWINDETAEHTVTAGSPGRPEGAFDLGLPGGSQVEQTFDEPGSFAYFCRIHPFMTAEVVVE